MNQPKHPEVTVQLSGEDGNAFFIIGRVSRALKRAGLQEEAQAFAVDAIATNSYDELLQLVMETVTTR